MVLLHDDAQLLRIELQKARLEFLRRAFLEFDEGMEALDTSLGQPALGQFLPEFRQRLFQLLAECGVGPP